MRIVEAFTDWCGHALALCPSCPTALEARDAFFTDDVATRLVGMAAPFVVTLGLVKVVLDRLRRRT